MRIRDVRSLLFHGLDPIRWFLVKKLFEVDGCGFREHGSCFFYGTNEYLAKIDSSMQEIKEIDITLYENLIGSEIVYISEFHGKDFARWSRGRFCLRNWVIKNNSTAVAFWIVAFYFQQKSIKNVGKYNYIFGEGIKSVLSGLDEAIDWFRVHGFPEEWIRMLEDVWYDKKGLSEKSQASLK